MTDLADEQPGATSAEVEAACVRVERDAGEHLDADERAIIAAARRCAAAEARLRDRESCCEDHCDQEAIEQANQAQAERMKRGDVEHERDTLRERVKVLEAAVDEITDRLLRRPLTDIERLGISFATVQRWRKALAATDSGK